jgi:GxxExxY protein
MPCTVRTSFATGGIVVELKALASIGRVEEAQLLHYLRASSKSLGLLANFGGTSLDWRRLVNKHPS